MKRIVIHHSASAFGTAVMIDDWHRHRTPPFRAIGYHAVIENGFPTKNHFETGERWKLLNGMISSGRAIDADDVIEENEVGAHALGFNKDSLGVCLIGNREFTKQAIISLVKLIRLWVVNFKIDVSEAAIGETIVGHGELPGASTECPCLDMTIVRRLVLNKSEAFSLMRSFSNVKEIY